MKTIRLLRVLDAGKKAYFIAIALGVFCVAVMKIAQAECPREEGKYPGLQVEGFFAEIVSLLPSFRWSGTETTEKGVFVSIPEKSISLFYCAAKPVTALKQLMPGKRTFPDVFSSASHTGENTQLDSPTQGKPQKNHPTFTISDSWVQGPDNVNTFLFKSEIGYSFEVLETIYDPP